MKFYYSPGACSLASRARVPARRHNASRANNPPTKPVATTPGNADWGGFRV